MNFGIPAAIAAPNAGTLWLLSGVLFIVVVAGAMIAVLAARRMFRESSRNAADFDSPKPRTDNPAAFITASMQAVIQKLKEQEKELEALHRSERERAQQTERMSEAVTHNMPAGLLLLNSAGLITSANPAAELALDVKSLVFRRYNEVLGADSRLTQLIAGCLDLGKTFRREEVEYLTPASELRELGVTISPITGTAGEVTGAICLLSDLTELAALQKQIHMKENLAALGELSAGIAHEFKNALATISGYAQMIRSEAEPGDIHDSAERILDQTRSLTHVVTEFLRFAKPLEICYETVAMQALVERVAEDLHEVFPQCTVECEGTFVDLPGDEALLRQALLNLTRNAAESGRDAGHSPRVVVSGSLEELGGRKWQRICVADNGLGIPGHDLPKIFLPFYTTKSEGTGLGLAVVQKVTLQHGGSIEARNRQGGGAEFLLWLPLRQDPLPSLFPSQAASI